MTDPQADTIAYYDRHATEYAAQTADLDLSPIYDRFLQHVPPGGRVLDAGCGVGRDALALVERGYEVVAIDAEEADGRALWEAVAERMTLAASATVERPRLGTPRLVQPRLGQGAFRLEVTAGYERRCAVSGERTLPILDAAHIRAFGAGGEHEASNGLLLRTDIHRLFDLGYVTVSGDGHFEVSRRLKADFDNGKHYYDLHGTTLRPPAPNFPRPAPEALAWHWENRFLG